ncbi:MAG: hypothetical protein A3A94_03660 [Candidatus Portnoybacteria bacterium RIFCSPLOWO2_01_FULL_43_11]|uniref:Glycosyl transferase family 1 domain-containing protein n=4 Tax=Bacteria candidate phyla TaxID=1783234 RepID=A0A1G2FST8_9BACT|nr:MAG: hypothetical protein A2713_01995 [candidate division WWE3 bacterium RIFCSPHIGHO2_01_FULL_35_17]OGZ37430.1 MAG: hypothetical protein A3E90_00650 [Candidatus Portnoybacteria bacterium RIFCSPHIGHO2_12_FULL_40_11]OGZ38446.1 MAG: hypothetical protein A3A94_03660 [Candidatus Portnoybacteria bacterium RIFCSPLOWO2_01_FULL_43_11]OGZ40802.1 MAG: hypothetical protein A3I20_02235 [Candidatus Portnoybacteria bacterium RIFCSPLOWO2_02_FULL_40_15]
MANNQEPRVLIFSTAYLPFIGGAELAIKEITDRVKNWSFDLITARQDRRLSKFEKQGNVNIYRLGLGLGFLDKFLLPISGFLKAVRLNKKRNYRFIWSIMASQAGIAAVYFKLFYPAKKILLTIQEGDPEEYLKRYVLNIEFLYKIFIRPWHLLPFRRADYITVISADLKERVIRSGAKCPIETVPNGVSLKNFKINNLRETDERQESELKLKLGVKTNEKVIITVSRLVKKNAVDDLIKAGQYLDLPFKILIIGQGKDEQKLKSLVEKLKFKNKVIFLGYIKHLDLPQYLSISDVFVRPSLSEGLGNAFLEAMAVGLPVIGTPVGGIPDFLKERETGLFCEPGNPKSIALKIKEILSDNELKERIIKNGKKLIFEKYDWESIALKMEEIFKKL